MTKVFEEIDGVKYDKEGRQLYPVLMEDEPEPIGLAADERGAARVIRRYCETELGDSDTGITAASVRYSTTRNAWVMDD